jgi:predicted DNA-binding protein
MHRRDGGSVALSLHFAQHGIVAGVNRRNMHLSDAQRSERISAVQPPAQLTMAEQRIRDRRRAGRPPAGAKEGEKVKDYPQLSIRVPVEFKARLNALSAVTGLAQWRVIVEAINCFFSDLPETDRELVDGLSERLMRAGQA